MFNKQAFETEHFSTEPAATLTVDSELRKAAANDAMNQKATPQADKPRRGRRQSLVSSSPVGGWKVRMW